MLKVKFVDFYFGSNDKNVSVPDGYTLLEAVPINEHRGGSSGGGGSYGVVLIFQKVGA